MSDPALFSLRAYRPGDYYIMASEGSGAASADACNSMERPVRIDQPQMPDAENGLTDPKPSSNDLQLGSPRDMRSRLRDLPHGHPSSPYNEDGSRRPPVLRLRDVDLPEVEEDRRRVGS